MPAAGYELHIRSLWRLGEQIETRFSALRLAIYYTRDQCGPGL